MPFIGLFCNQTVEVKVFVRMASGGPVYMPSEYRRCRIRVNRKLNSSGVYIGGVIDEEHASGKMYCTGEPIPTRSIVVYEDHEYTVTNCTISRGFGYDHLEVTLE